jgi:peroxiredoxin
VQRVYEAFKDKDVVVLGISIDGTGEKAVQPYMAEHGFTFPTLLDQRMEVARKFGARGVPYTIVVNRDGKIIARGLGPFPLDTPEFSRYLQALMELPRG